MCFELTNASNDSIDNSFQNFRSLMSQNLMNTYFKSGIHFKPGIGEWRGRGYGGRVSRKS